jgi:hypothetical protein
MPRPGYVQTPEHKAKIGQKAGRYFGRLSEAERQQRRLSLRLALCEKYGCTIEEYQLARFLQFSKAHWPISKCIQHVRSTRAVLDRPGAETDAGGAVHPSPAPSAFF